jgi:hypothetical protein
MGTLPSAPIITAASRHGFPEMLRLAPMVTPASGVNPFSANEMHAFPFRLDAPWTTIHRVLWWNGSAAGGSSSMAIYDADYELMGQSSSATGTSNSGMQLPTWTAITLRAGLYYCALAHDSGTTNRFFRWSLATNGPSIFRMAGCWKQTGITVGSLPDPATPIAYTAISMAVFGMMARPDHTGSFIL